MMMMIMTIQQGLDKSKKMCRKRDEEKEMEEETGLGWGERGGDILVYRERKTLM